MSDPITTAQFVYTKPEYPLNAGDSISAYAGPEWNDQLTAPYITTTNINNIITITPPICKICKFCDRCKKFGTAILTIDECRKGLGLEERVVIKVKKKPR